MARCCTYSHRPTPPACGHTGTPNFAASSRTASTSLTPPSRHASISQTSMAPAWKSCLKTTRFCTCSPVLPADPGPGEDVERFGRGQRVLDVAEVDRGDDLLG